MFDVPFHIWLAAAAIAGAVPVLWWSVASDRVSKKARSALASARSVSTYRELSLARPARDRFVDGIQTTIGERLRRLTPVGAIEQIERRMALAGVSGRWTVERILIAKGLLGLGTFFLFFLIALGTASVGRMIAAIAFAAIAFWIPDFLLVRKGDTRQAEMRDQLPDVIDQVVIGVEAGLSFDASVDRIARRGRTHLDRELQRVMQDIALGMSRKDALTAMSERTTIPELRELILAMNQSDQHGLPLGRVLRVQADEIRDKRKQRAEERAMKVPVKIVVPLILCILPALMVVVVGPAIVRIANDLRFS